jgi:hypothetical protein
MNEGLENIKQISDLEKKVLTLCDLLSQMCCNADEDTPAEYRTRHFRDAMNGAYEYLEEIGYLEKEGDKND